MTALVEKEPINSQRVSRCQLFYKSENILFVLSASEPINKNCNQFLLQMYLSRIIIEYKW